MPWFGKRLPWGDRYDAYGALIGVPVFLLVGVLLTSAGAKPIAAWLVSFGLGTGVLNMASFVMRRIAGVPNRSLVARKRNDGSPDAGREPGDRS